MEQLILLEQANAGDFAEALADNIMSPRELDTVAFRDPRLAFKSLNATRLLAQNAQQTIERRDRNARQRRQTQHFSRLVGLERRLLNDIVTGLRAQQGLLSTPPNPRQRALRRLADENLKGDIPRGRFRELLEEEKEVDKQRRRDAKHRAREERRAERAG